MRIDDLRRCLATAFERLQLTPEDAKGLSGLLVDCKLRGHPDHGVAALGVLAGFYLDGTLNPRPCVRVLHETEGRSSSMVTAAVDPAPTRAMRWCIDRAREGKGMAVAAVRDWQLLVAPPYARLAAETGLVGFACTNFVPLVAPPGGRIAVLGTNPFAPTGDIDAGRGHVRSCRAADHRPGSRSRGWVAGAAWHPVRAP